MDLQLRGNSSAGSGGDGYILEHQASDAYAPHHGEQRALGEDLPG